PSAPVKSGANRFFYGLRCPAALDEISTTVPGGFGMIAPDSGNGLYPHSNYYYLLAGSGANNFTLSWYGANGVTGDNTPEDHDVFPSTLIPNFPLRSYPSAMYNNQAAPANGANGFKNYPGTAFGMPKINQVKLTSEVALF